MGHAYGYIPTPEHEKAAAPTRTFNAVLLPAKVDLRSTGFLPPVFDQGQLGSCTANGSGAAYSYDDAKQGQPAGFVPSRLFIYYNERAAQGTIGHDSGATITQAVQALSKYGAPPESDWPYDISRYTEKPPAAAYANGRDREAILSAQVGQDLPSLQAALAAGFPIIIGFTVFESFESATVAQTGEMPMPAPGEQVLGGHCVLVVGYDDSIQRFVVRNSWGTGWGDGGYFTMPYNFLTNPDYANDFWVIEKVTIGTPEPSPAVKRSWWSDILRFLGF